MFYAYANNVGADQPAHHTREMTMSYNHVTKSLSDDIYIEFFHLSLRFDRYGLHNVDCCCHQQLWEPCETSMYIQSNLF